MTETQEAIHLRTIFPGFATSFHDYETYNRHDNNSSDNVTNISYFIFQDQVNISREPGQHSPAKYLHCRAQECGDDVFFKVILD